LPFIGSIPFLPKVKGPIAFASKELVERYGKIVGMYFGNISAVAIYDFDALKEIYNLPEAAGRPSAFVYKNRMLGKNLGILLNDSANYRVQRISTHRTLKDFGFGRHGIEETLQFESDYLIQHLRANTDKSHDLMSIFNFTVLNTLWKIVGDKRYEIDDPRMQGLIEMVNDANKADNLTLLFMFPFLRHLMPERSGWTLQKEVSKNLNQLAREMIREHLDTYDPEEAPRDFIDVYIKQMEADPKQFNQEELSVVIIDLFIAGSETTATTLYWLIRCMLEYPEVQRKVQEELDQILGNSSPTFEDRGKLVYTEATIMEAMRLYGVLPYGVPRRALADIHYKGYTIPKGSVMYGVARHIMQDPSYWKNAEEFEPERFICTDPVTKKLSLRKEDRFIPFGIGRRVCLGELLAKQELFIIATKMLQNFSFGVAEGHDLPEISDCSRGLIIGPRRYHAKLTARK